MHGVNRNMITMRSYPYDWMTVITGVGRHSKNAQARIRPAVNRLLMEGDFKYTEIRPGCFRIRTRRH